MIKLNLRLNLADVLACDVNSILNAISDAGRKLDRSVKLKLWYESDIDNSTVLDFVTQCETMKIYTTTIVTTKYIAPNDRVWFDIISLGNENTRSRFEYVYPIVSTKSLLRGIEYFYKVAKFCTSPKPPKPHAKRTD